jgi:hypothetical protein
MVVNPECKSKRIIEIDDHFRITGKRKQKKSVKRGIDAHNWKWVICIKLPRYIRLSRLPLVASYLKSMDCRVMGTVWEENNSSRPLALIANDEFQSKDFCSFIWFRLVYRPSVAKGRRGVKTSVVVALVVTVLHSYIWEFNLSSC